MWQPLNLMTACAILSNNNCTKVFVIPGWFSTALWRNFGPLNSAIFGSLLGWTPSPTLFQVLALHLIWIQVRTLITPRLIFVSLNPCGLGRWCPKRILPRVLAGFTVPFVTEWLPGPEDAKQNQTITLPESDVFLSWFTQKRNLTLFPLFSQYRYFTYRNETVSWDIYIIYKTYVYIYIILFTKEDQIN